MTNNCSNSFCSQFLSISGVAVWAILPGTLATLTSKVSTDLGGQVLGEDICGPDIMFGKKKHAHVCDRALLSIGGVDGAIAMGLLLALGGSRFLSSCLGWLGRALHCGTDSGCSLEGRKQNWKLEPE
jgi:hypothetical protein